MGRMIEGEWKTDWYEPDEEGHFKRPNTVFHGRVSREASAEFAPEPGRYHLYVAWACPWAHRTLIARHLLGLEDAIDVSIVHPLMLEDGWTFDASQPGCTPDKLYDHEHLRDLYRHADARYTGRVTVPVLWDKRHETIVNNESREIVHMLDREFVEPGSRDVELFPHELAGEVNAVTDAIYQPINNGVYRAGFATSQTAYEEAAEELFAALDHWEGVLAGQRYLCGDRLTAADVFMFTTLFRFDLVYHTHFKCNVRRIIDYPNLWGFVRDIYQTKNIAGTTHIAQTKLHYFGSHDMINPTRIVPIGPEIDYSAPHDRSQFG